MMRTEIKHSVELLRDRKGIYGIGVAKCEEIDYPPKDLILRPDHLAEGQIWQHAVLQRITGGFRHGMFCNMLEERHRQLIHHAMLRRAGLPWPPPQESPYYWSTDHQQQIRNRQIYHGLRLGSLSIVNRLIGRALEEATDPVVIKIARRFGFRYRYPLYRAAARSPRVLQLSNVFPALALAIFAWGSRRINPSIQEAIDLVEVGAPNLSSGSRNIHMKWKVRRTRSSVSSTTFRIGFGLVTGLACQPIFSMQLLETRLGPAANNLSSAGLLQKCRSRP